MRQTPEEVGAFWGVWLQGSQEVAGANGYLQASKRRQRVQTHPTKAKFLTDLTYKPLLGDVGRGNRPQVKLPRPKAWVAGLDTAVPKSQHCMHKQRWRQEGQGTKGKQKSK